MIINSLSIFGRITLRWMLQGLSDDESTLVQVMAWRHQTRSHYLSHYLSSMSPYGITRPQWVNQWLSHSLNHKYIQFMWNLCGIWQALSQYCRCRRFKFFLLPYGSLEPMCHDLYGSQRTGNGSHYWCFYSMEILRCIPRTQVVVNSWQVPFELQWVYDEERNNFGQFQSISESSGLRCWLPGTLAPGQYQLQYWSTPDYWRSGGRFKNHYEILNLRALQIFACEWSQYLSMYG